MHDQPQLSQTTQVKRLTKGPSWRLTHLYHKKSDAWLHALPISSIGLRMDNEVVRIAVGLRFGSATVPATHNCNWCEAVSWPPFSCAFMYLSPMHYTLNVPVIIYLIYYLVILQL